MRTTLTLEDDVAARLREEMRRSGKSFKETLNDALRRGLLATRGGPKVRPFKIEARPLGLRPGVGYDRVSELLEQLDGPSAR